MAIGKTMNLGDVQDKSVLKIMLVAPLRHGPFHRGPQKTTGLDFFLLITDA